MDNSFAVRGRQTVRRLEGVLNGSAQRQCTVPKGLAQGLAFEQFADKVGSAIMNPGIVNGQNVRMIEGREPLGLLLESAQSVRICHELLGQHLHRDVAIQPRVARDIVRPTGPRRAEQ